ncbi:LamG-like jellyroll fold domain-containing protein [Dactylosporangium salmoneum]|uniref:F5/8 type C domain-containing protein n=1 Tax=Dactylosporangium salmoneum TaxID=53361 RepID=A0ABN3HUT2_9ACTN
MVNIERRTLLQAVLAAPAAGATASLLATPAAPAAAAEGPVDADSPRFALAVLPDTQYLFDEDSSDPEPLKATFRYLAQERKDANIVFMTHLGDVTEHGSEHEVTLASDTFRTLDGKLPYSVLAGNHDIRSSTDDQRGDSVYLRAFGPQRFAKMRTFGGASPDGYNSYHVLRAGGRDWLVLALDWRVSDKGLAWAQNVINEHRTLPVILTTHDLAWSDDAGQAQLSDNGQRLWDRLIRNNDQIFLTLNGHYWPPGRATLKNAAGNEVQVHITNYQDRYYGGAGMIWLYHFDLARNVIDVETFSPWFLARDSAKRTPLEAETIELTSAVDRFSMKIDFAARFGGFAPVIPPPPRPASAVMPDGTAAYWRFDAAGLSGTGTAGTPVAAGTVVRDLTGHGNDLTVQVIGTAVPGSLRSLVGAVTASAENAPNEAAANVKDGNPSTKWLAFSRTGWVTYQLTKPATVVWYSLTSANDAPGRDPRDFTLQGSNDANTWTDLDRRTGQSFSGRFATNTYSFTNTTAYRYYRLNITANSGDSLVQLAEWNISDGSSQVLTWSPEHHAGQPAHGSLRFDGGKSPDHGAILRAGANAPINSMKFTSGYTIEAFIKLPEPFEGDHAWMGILSWEGRSGDAGKTTGWSTLECTCSLNISPERFLQYVVYPDKQDADPTSWSHALPTGRWTHIAVVNDAKQTVVYIDGSKIARNPTQPSTGIATQARPFAIGATSFDLQYGQGFYGWIGDVRITTKALRPRDFLTPYA